MNARLFQRCVELEGALKAFGDRLTYDSIATQDDYPVSIPTTWGALRRAKALTGPDAASTAILAYSGDPRVALIARLREAIIWMTGSSDFAPGGIAREGFEQFVLPLLSEKEAKG